jgi:Uma2 family endonuclease
MNEITSLIPRPRATTQAADGIPRLKWSLDEFERLSELGFFGGLDRPRERLELIDGELVPMNAKGVRHERVRGKLTLYLARALTTDFDVYGEPGWRPGGDRYLEPVIIICKSADEPSAVPPSQVLLLIEVADSSLAYDTGLKGRLYATLGVPEYWVIDANRLTTRIHLGPTESGYTAITNHASSETLTPHQLPSLTLRLSDLGLD